MKKLLSSFIFLFAIACNSKRFKEINFIDYRESFYHGEEKILKLDGSISFPYNRVYINDKPFFTYNIFFQKNKEIKFLSTIIEDSITFQFSHGGNYYKINADSKAKFYYIFFDAEKLKVVLTNELLTSE